MRANEAAEQVAITVTVKWLALVDAGEYAKSWNQAASLFKSGIQTSSLFKPGISEQEWQSSLAAMQTQFGKAVARNLKSKQYAKELSDELEGEYVMLRYETSFKRKNGVETVVLMKDKDGEWRVSGYRVILVPRTRDLVPSQGPTR